MYVCVCVHARQGEQREQLLRKVEVQMPALKKSNTYGKHIIAVASLDPSGPTHAQFRPLCRRNCGLRGGTRAMRNPAQGSRGFPPKI